jgi:hypothetical protein
MRCLAEPNRKPSLPLNTNVQHIFLEGTKQGLVYGIIVDSSHFSTRGSQVRCKLANYVSKFEKDEKYTSTVNKSSQVHFYCKQMFIQ